MPEDTAISRGKIGIISHFYGQIGVAVVDLTGELKVGDKIRIKGAVTDIEQDVESMQIDKKPVGKASKGESIGLKAAGKIREGDDVYKI